MRPRAVLSLLAFLAFISLGLPDGLLGVSWPSIRADFGLPLDSLGVVVAISMAGYLVSSFLSGRLLKVTSIGTVLALSTLAAAVALLGFSLTQSWPVLLACGLLAGLAGGGVDAGLNAYGAKHFSARVLNWLHASFGIGTTLGPLIVTAVLSSGNVWRWSYVIVGSGQLLLAVTFFLTRGRWIEAQEIGSPRAPKVTTARTRDTLRRPVVWLGMATFFVYAGVEVVTAQWSYSLLTLHRGVSVTTAGLLIGLFWGSLTVGRVLLARLKRTFEVNYCCYGARKLWRELRNEGLEIGRDRVARLMRSAGIRGAGRVKRIITTVPAPVRRDPPDLVKRQWDKGEPDRVWVADLTYVPSSEGTIYTSFIQDAGTRLAFDSR